jgi:hypothetical protein
MEHVRVAEMAKAGRDGIGFRESEQSAQSKAQIQIKTNATMAAALTAREVNKGRS